MKIQEVLRKNKLAYDFKRCIMYKNITLAESAR